MRPIERRKVYELVAERLVEDISASRLKPGQALPTERQIAEALSVGRSSVREAMRMLESRGLVVSAGYGARIVADHGKPLDASLAMLVEMRDSGLQDLLEVRKIIEVEAAGLAAERRSDKDMERMRRAIEAMDEGLGSAERYIAGDIEFHLAVAAATGNTLARDMMRAIREVMRRALRSIYPIPGSAERSARQHRQIFEAVVAGRADEARALMRGHLLGVEADVRSSRSMGGPGADRKEGEGG